MQFLPMLSSWRRPPKARLIELECKRFIDSASYFEWLSKNKGMMFEDTKSRTEVESHETSPIIWTESEAEGKRLVGGCVELHTYMKETYDHGSGNCTTSRGLAGLKWQTLGMKDKARLIISLVLFLLFVFAAMAMVLFSTSIESLIDGFVRAFASVVNCRWSSADSVSQEAFAKVISGKSFQRHGIVGVKADLCSSIVAALVVSVLVYAIP